MPDFGAAGRFAEVAALGVAVDELVGAERRELLARDAPGKL